MAAIIDVSATPKQPVVEVATQTPQIAAETAPIEPVQVEVPGKISKTGDFDLSMWPEILSEIKNRAASIYTALRLAEPGISDGTLILSFQFPLHKKKLEQSKHIVLIGEVIQEFTGSNMEVKCVLSEKPIKKIISDKVRSVATVAQQPSELSTISNIFGGAEVLES
jgi:hypothetical protein